MVKICFLTASEFYRERFRKEQGFDEFDQESLLAKPIDMKYLVYTTKNCWILNSSGKRGRSNSLVSPCNKEFGASFEAS